MTGRDITGEGLRAAIGFPSALMLVIGGMVGVGVFVNPAVVARSLHTPGLVLAAWGAGGAIALLGALVYAELAARMPTTGGEYVYIRDTYGPLAGFLFGWTTLLVVHTGGMAAVAIVCAKNLNVLAGGSLSEPVVAVSVLAILAGVNGLGVTMGNGAQSSLGLLKIVAIAALILAGVAFAPHAAAQPTLPTPPLASADFWKTFGAGLIPVVFSYGGWQTSNYVAGEIRNADRNLGRALVVGVLTVIALYILVNVACLRVLGVEALGKTLTPTSDVLERVAGPLGGKLAAGAIALSAIAFVSQSMLTGPRVCFAMARDGLFFRQAAGVSESSRAPVAAIAFMAAWTAVLALTGRYDQILSYVTAMNFLFFALSASCLFVLRRRERTHGRIAVGFRTPWHPWTAGAFVAACGVVVAASFWAYPINSLVGYVIMLLGVPPYLYWRRQRLQESPSPT